MHLQNSSKLLQLNTRSLSTCITDRLVLRFCSSSFSPNHQWDLKIAFGGHILLMQYGMVQCGGSLLLLMRAYDGRVVLRVSRFHPDNIGRHRSQKLVDLCLNSNNANLLVSIITFSDEIFITHTHLNISSCLSLHLFDMRSSCLLN